VAATQRTSVGLLIVDYLWQTPAVNESKKNAACFFGKGLELCVHFGAGS
jgi:hypothetical protein